MAHPQVVPFMAQHQFPPLGWQLRLEVNHVVPFPIDFFSALVHKAGGQPPAQPYRCVPVLLEPFQAGVFGVQ